MGDYRPFNPRSSDHRPHRLTRPTKPRESGAFFVPKIWELVSRNGREPERVSLTDISRTLVMTNIVTWYVLT